VLQIWNRPEQSHEVSDRTTSKQRRGAATRAAEVTHDTRSDPAISVARQRDFWLRRSPSAAARLFANDAWSTARRQGRIAASADAANIAWRPTSRGKERASYVTVFQDGEKYRMYYRGSHYSYLGGKTGRIRDLYCYAESRRHQLD
jgi:hypothetical protein